MGSCCGTNNLNQKETKEAIVEVKNDKIYLNPPPCFMNHPEVKIKTTTKNYQEIVEEKPEINLFKEINDIDKSIEKNGISNKKVSIEKILNINELSLKEKKRIVTLSSIYTENFEKKEKAYYEDQLKTQRFEIKLELFKKIYDKFPQNTSFQYFQNIIELLNENKELFYKFLEGSVISDQNSMIIIIIDFAEILLNYRKYEKNGVSDSIEYFFQKYKFFFDKLKFFQEKFLLINGLNFEENNIIGNNNNQNDSLINVIKDENTKEEEKKNEEDFNLELIKTAQFINLQEEEKMKDNEKIVEKIEQLTDEFREKKRSEHELKIRNFSDSNSELYKNIKENHENIINKNREEEYELNSNKLVNNEDYVNNYIDQIENEDFKSLKKDSEENSKFDVVKNLNNNLEEKENSEKIFEGNSFN